MKNIATGQAEALFQIQRRQHHAPQHAGFEIGRIVIHGVDHQIGSGFFDLIPIKIVRQHRIEMLTEQTGDVLPRRRQRIVHGRRDQHLHHRRARAAEGACIEIRLLHVFERGRDDDAGLVIVTRLFGLGAGHAGKTRQLRQRNVHAKRARRALVVAHALQKIGIQRILRHQLGVEQFGVHARHHATPFNHTAIGQLHALCAAHIDAHVRYFAAGDDFHTAPLGLFAHRLRDRAHAADGVAPHTAMAVDLADHVMQQHIRRAGRVGAGKMAHNRVKAERCLDRIRLEPRIEHVARAFGKKIQHVAPRGHVELFHALGRFQRAHEIRDTAPDIRRRFQQHLSHHVGGALQHGVVLRQPFGVAF